MENITNVIGVKITFPLQTSQSGQTRTIEIYTIDGNCRVFELTSPPNTMNMPIDIETPTMD